MKGILGRIHGKSFDSEFRTFGIPNRFGKNTFMDFFFRTRTFVNSERNCPESELSCIRTVPNQNCPEAELFVSELSRIRTVRIRTAPNQDYPV
uniref:Uncharacterized protein n=1 Tax=Caenorhabditis japonica TaxID=281687 RepID=A0A8R1EUV4_CAEJA